MSSNLKFHLTQSLLSAWLYSYRQEDGFSRFRDAILRKKEPPTKAMLDGIRFENCVNNALDGSAVPKGETAEEMQYFRCVRQLSGYLNGSRQQVCIYKDIMVDGVCFELQGILDFLRGGIIFDTKFSRTYALNKYLESPQHPMYFYLVPEAREFQYLICDGKFVYRERYLPEDTVPIEVIIRQFMQYLDRCHLTDIYTSIWNTKEFYQPKEKKK